MMSRLFLVMVLIVMMSCGGCGRGGGDGLVEQGEREVPVTVVTALTDDVVFSSAKVGVVKVNRQVSINFTTPGRIEEFFVEEDDYVREGEPVARLDDTELRAALRTARIRYDDLAKRQEQMQRMLDRRATTQSEFDQVQTAYLTAREEVELAEERLSRIVVKAPFTGVVLRKLAEVGSFVPPGVPVAVLVDLDRVRTELDFSDREIGAVTVGSGIDVRADAFPDRVFPATIERIVASTDPRSRMTRVEVVMDNPNRMLRPGMLVRSEVVVGAYRGMIVIPVDCLIYQGARTFVYVVEPGDGRARRRDVTVETIHRDRAVVSEGITQGETVVNSGQSYLSDGTVVRILE